MKTVLTLTDFSSNATHAAHEALIIGGKLQADLLLFNSYITYPADASYANAGWLAEDFLKRQTTSRLGLETLAEGLESITNELDEGDRAPAIYWESDDSDLANKVNDICRHKNIALIVMGARADNKGDFLYGEDTNSVIEQTRCPVLIIPPKTSLKQIRKLVFATDFEEQDLNIIHQLTKLGHALHCEIEVVHIIAPGENYGLSDGHKAAFINAFAKIKYQGLSYREASGENVVATLKDICNANGKGILVMLHHQHSFFVRLFTHSKTRELMADQKVPLLVFPSAVQKGAS